MKLNLFKKILFIVVPLIVVILSATGFLYYQNNWAAVAKQGDSIQEELAQLMALPNEQATITVIGQVQQLQIHNSFFEGLSDGQFLVTFPKADRAVVYDKARHLIVKIGPVPTFDDVEIATVTIPKISVEVRNGSSDLGRAATLAKELGETGFDVIDINKAEHQDYKQSLIINFRGEELNAEAMNLAARLGGRLTNELPKGESTSSAGILLIVGN